MINETTPLKSNKHSGCNSKNHSQKKNESITSPPPAPKAEGILNESQNILLLFRLEDFRRRSHINFWLALICLLCCGVNIGLLLLNYVLHNDPNPPAVSERTFHLTEFWTTFVYALIDAYALVTSPKTLQTICYNTLLLKILFFFNVVAALVPAMLVTLDTEYFESIAHELEYINEFSLSLVSFILLASLLKNDGSLVPGTATSLALVVVSLIVAVITFTVYNLGHEEAAHYFEFCFNVSTCMVTFWFCMDNRFLADMEVGQILFGVHRDCNLCRSDVSALQSVTTIQWRRSYGSSNVTAVDATIEKEVDGSALLVAYDEELGIIGSL